MEVAVVIAELLQSLAQRSATRCARWLVSEATLGVAALRNTYRCVLEFLFSDDFISFNHLFCIAAMQPLHSALMKRKRRVEFQVQHGV